MSQIPTLAAGQVIGMPRRITPTVLPMQFPDTEAQNRARERAARDSAAADNETFAARQRHEQMLGAARQIGYDAGHLAASQSGHRGAFWWGWICGVCSFLMFGGLGLVIAVGVMAGGHKL
jgi:hypothetical protein